MKTNPPPAKPHSYLPFAKISPRTAVWSLLAGASMVLPVTLLVSLLPLPGLDADMAHVSAARIAPLYNHPWRMAFGAVLVAPFAEEIVYRGLILQLLRRHAPLWLAVAVSTLLFAGTHFTFSFQNSALAVIVGLAFARLALRSRSLFPAMLCHAGVNLASLFVLRPVFEAAGFTPASSLLQPLPVLLLGSSLALFVASLRALREECSPRPAGVLVAPQVPVPSV